MLEEQSKILPEERAKNREFYRLLQEYNKMTEIGIPFGMPYDFEDLKTAVETKKPFQEWEKYKPYYEPLPEGAIV